ncbi:MAG: NAD+ synthase [Deltaproteobacteria bacterium]|nr:NAD+ synthase [Deltaproteobacteria bacterium]
MKIALAQINTTVGDFEGTVRKVARQIQKAKDLGAELIAFPEMTTTGYPPRDLVENPGFIDANLKALQSIARLSQGIGVIVGYLDRNKKEGGKGLLNFCALFENGELKGRYVKMLLPTYDVFDEGRYFAPGQKVGLWEWHGAKIGISICEDAWNAQSFWQRPLYERDPIAEQVKAGADFCLNLSCSPYSIGREKLRREMIRAHAVRNRRPFFYVNLVGGNDELVFDGRSLAVDAEGKVIGQGRAFAEDLVVVDMKNPPLPPFVKGGVGGFEEKDDLESVYHALVLGIRDYVRKCGFKKVVLGLSGGIDSSLTAVLAAEALGRRNLLGVIMPSPYSSRESVEDARRLAATLKISMKTISITSIYNSYRRQFSRLKKQPDVADENLQARIRGNLLMALSNRDGYLTLTTGNKSELAVGYCTLYGDMSGGLAVISDLPKQMVYDLSRWINRKREIIPERVFTKAPTAELRPNQTDQDTLPPYEILDKILKAYIEEHRMEDEIVASGFPRKTVRWVLRNVDRNEYKRRQAALGIRVTSKAFGIGRRYPIARKV